MAGIRWLFIFLLWTALDLSGPLLPVPVEVFEGSEEAAHRSQVRRRVDEPEVRAVSVGDQQAPDGAARLPRFVPATRPHRASVAVAVRKLPSSGPDSDAASDDH